MDPTLVARDNAKDVLDFQFYYYEPSLPAAVIFIVLFASATSLHCYQMIRTKTWFLIPFVIGAIMETVGYIGRAISASENSAPDYSLGPYIQQSLLLLVAPALFAASIYMELGRIVLMVDGDKALFIRRTWLTKIFVIGDVIAFMLQAGGAGLLASNDADMIKMGKTLVIAGLIAQVVFFGLFVAAAVIFHLRFSRAPTQAGQDTPWKRHMSALYAVSILIFVRSIVRVVEYIQGYSGYLMSHEVFLYVFDAVPMFLAVACLNWIHPGEVAKYVRQLRGNANGEKNSTNADTATV